MSGDRHENSKPVQIPVLIQNHLTLLLQLRKKYTTVESSKYNLFSFF